MKKLLFTAYTLDVGGIETALVSLVNRLVQDYEITLVLEKKQGLFLNSINDKVQIIEYTPSNYKNKLVRKILNALKRVKFILKHRNRYDFSACFATYSFPGSFCARTASKNSALWVHSDYLGVYKNNIEEMIKFFSFVQYDKFKNIICVSQKAKESFIKVFPNSADKVQVVKNLINDKDIIKKSKEKIDMQKEEEKVTFLHVGRHEEDSKKITKLIEVADMLKKDGYKFKILLVGEGKDTELYKSFVSAKKLEDIILFLGEKKNPYPYFNISDAIVLTSDYEGYPVVFVEAMVLNLPIITTDVSDATKDIENKFGIVTKKEIESIYSGMKQYIEKGYKIKEKFDANRFNMQIINQIQNLIYKGAEKCQK